MIPLRRPAHDVALSAELRATLEMLQAQVNAPGATKDEQLAVWGLLSGTPLYQELRDTLLEITRGKCSYCEGKARRFEVDHYAPKAKFPDQMFAWGNLLVACGECNGIKRTAYPLIDPANEDPGALLGWDRYGSPRLQDELEEPDEQRARRTINSLKLNEEDICGRRKQALLLTVKALNEAEEGPSKDRLKTLAKALNPNAPHRAILRQWLHHPIITARLNALEAAHPVLTPTLQFYRDLGPPRPPAPTPPSV